MPRSQSLLIHCIATSLLHSTLGGYAPSKFNRMRKTTPKPFARTARTAGTTACRTLELRPGRSPTDRSTRCRDRVVTRLTKRPEHRGKRGRIIPKILTYLVQLHLTCSILINLFPHSLHVIPTGNATGNSYDNGDEATTTLAVPPCG